MILLRVQEPYYQGQQLHRLYSRPQRTTTRLVGEIRVKTKRDNCKGDPMHSPERSASANAWQVPLSHVYRQVKTQRTRVLTKGILRKESLNRWHARLATTIASGRIIPVRRICFSSKVYVTALQRASSAILLRVLHFLHYRNTSPVTYNARKSIETTFGL